MRGVLPGWLTWRQVHRQRPRAAVASAGSSEPRPPTATQIPLPPRHDAAATSTSPIPATQRPTPKGVPRLVSDADLLRSLRGEDSGSTSSRAYAPPAEPRVCRCCDGTGEVRCLTCGGSGRLPAGGYRAANPVLMPKIVGTQWTAAERTLGRTHFRCASKRRAAGAGGGGGGWFVLMVAACDESIRLWVEAKALRDRSRWTPGWVTVADVVDRRSKKDGKGVGPRSGAGCKACGGGGRAPCPLCTRPGEVIEV